MQNKETRETSKTFENEWCEKELDVLVLIAYSSWIHGNLGHAEFIAAVDLETEELSTDFGRLSWVISKKSFFNKIRFNLKENNIYRLKLRKRITVDSQANCDNEYMVVKVIKKTVSNPRLEEIKNDYLKPVN